MATILDTLITKLGFETDTKGLDRAESGLSDLKTKVIAVAGIVGTVLGGGFLVNRVADAADETLKFADSVGVAVEEVDALGFAVQRQGGSIEGLRSSLFNMNTKIGEAARGTGEAKTALEAYDIQLEKTDGTIKTSAELFLEINKAFKDLSKVEQFDLANKFGIDQGTIRLLQTAPEEVANLLTQAKSLGVLTRQEAQQAAEFNDSLTNMARGLNRIAMESGKALFQPLTDLFNLIAEGTQYVREHSTFFKILIGTLTAVSTAWGLVKAQAIGAQIAMFAMPLTIIALITLFALLLEDAYAYFNGQDSLIGDAIKKWPELETTMMIVKDAWDAIFRIMSDTFKYWKEEGPGLAETIKEWIGPLIKVAEELDRILGISRDLRSMGEQLNPFRGGLGLGQDIDIGTGNKLSLGQTVGQWLKTKVLGMPQGMDYTSYQSPSSSGNNTNTVTIQKLEVDARGGDSAEIGRNVSKTIGAELQNMVQNVDSQIAR